MDPPSDIDPNQGPLIGNTALLPLGHCLFSNFCIGSVISICGLKFSKVADLRLTEKRQ